MVLVWPIGVLSLYVAIPNKRASEASAKKSQGYPYTHRPSRAQCD
jgi:hypothetical protein